MTGSTGAVPQREVLRQRAASTQGWRREVERRVRAERRAELAAELRRPLVERRR